MTGQSVLPDPRGAGIAAKSQTASPNQHPISPVDFLKELCHSFLLATNMSAKQRGWHDEGITRKEQQSHRKRLPEQRFGVFLMRTMRRLGVDHVCNRHGYQADAAQPAPQWPTSGNWEDRRQPLSSYLRGLRRVDRYTFPRLGETETTREKMYLSG